MEVEEEVDEAILELMKIKQISKIEAEAEINNLANPRQSVLDVINLAITVLNVILNYLTTKKNERNLIMQKRKKLKPC